ncbi:hypothetical protein D9V86_09890 [Bacteroidetes/Chlorobi group bacterium ChocPot_Mid]|nr:MAG: hypothetical protein D9V86_09890 [Bacteroidetes/Chlorobi group bacterium ChocPot_Mid]
MTNKEHFLKLPLNVQESLMRGVIKSIKGEIKIAFACDIEHVIGCIDYMEEKGLIECDKEQKYNLSKAKIC